MAKKKGSAKKGLVVDFTGVESSGKHPEGRFVFAVDSVELKNSENSGNDYLNFKLKSAKGAVYYTCSLAAHALWNLKNFLEACGQEVPEGELSLDLEEMVGLELGCEIVTEKYQGKPKAVVGSIFAADDVDSDGEEEEEAGEDGDVTYADVQEMELDDLLELAEANDIKVTKKQQKKLDELRDYLCEKLDLEEEEEEEEGEESELTYEAVQEMDADELDELCEEHDIKVKAKDKKKIAGYRDAVCEALDLEEEEEEEEEGSDELTAEAVNEMDADELDELCEEHDLKISKKAKKKVDTYRAAVIEELELDEEEEEEEETKSKGKGKKK